MAALALIVAVPIAGQSKSGTEVIAPTVVQATTTKAVVKSTKVSLDPALLPICSCESVGVPNATPQQFNKDGSVKRGRINSHDIGMCQINETYHGAEAKKLGMDIYTTEGNIKFANYLYEHQGTKPWNWSKSCWGK